MLVGEQAADPCVEARDDRAEKWQEEMPIELQRRDRRGELHGAIGVETFPRACARSQSATGWASSRLTTIARGRCSAMSRTSHHWISRNTLREHSATMATRSRRSGRPPPTACLGTSDGRIQLLEYAPTVLADPPTARTPLPDMPTEGVQNWRSSSSPEKEHEETIDLMGKQVIPTVG